MDDKSLGLYFQLFNEIGIIGQLSRAVMDDVLPDGLITPHFSILNHLTRVKDGHTPLKLASAFQVPKTTMTHTLSGLEAHGLIEMRPNPEDGRSKQVWITEKGATLRLQTIARLGEEFETLAEAFPSPKIADLIPRLAEIRKFMDAARD